VNSCQKEVSNLIGCLCSGYSYCFYWQLRGWNPADINLASCSCRFYFSSASKWSETWVTLFSICLCLYLFYFIFFSIFFVLFFFRHASTAAYLFELHICNVCGRIDNEVDVNVAEWSCVGRSASGWPSFRFLSPFWLGFFFVIFLWKLYDLQPAADLSHVCPLIYGTSCSSINLTHIRLDPIAAGQGTYSIKRHVTLPAQCNWSLGFLLN